MYLFIFSYVFDGWIVSVFGLRFLSAKVIKKIDIHECFANYFHLQVHFFCVS